MWNHFTKPPTAKINLNKHFNLGEINLKTIQQELRTLETIIHYALSMSGSLNKQKICVFSNSNTNF